jgi:hypothetical protein
VKDKPEAHKARNEKWNKARLPEAERCEMEIHLGRSLPKRILRSAIDRFLAEGPRQPKPKPAPSVVDLTPISQATIDYWIEQGYRLEDVQDDWQYQSEIKEANAENIKNGRTPYDPNVFGPKDPSHPYAYTPRYVTFAMRRAQGFRCYVMGWHETDWVLNKANGEIRLVGRLTRDHTKAATHGGMTSHDNLRMVAALVNRKKGHKFISYDQLREHLAQYWELYKLTEEELGTLDFLRSKGVKHITL